MAIEPTPYVSATSGSRSTAEKRADATQIIVELAAAGLALVEIDDDGDISFVLTARGQRAARLMAFSRDSHALVLLGALVGTDHGPN